MNYLYHRTFLCPAPYIHKVGFRGKNQKFPRLRNGYGIMALSAAASRRKERYIYENRISVQERLKDLRVEAGLNLEELAQETAFQNPPRQL